MPVRHLRGSGVFVSCVFVVLTISIISLPVSPQSATPGAPRQSAALRIKFERTKARLERGRYLVRNVADCFGCHSQIDWKTGLPRPGTEGGGGQVEDDTLPFKVWAPNISPDPETGGGTWRDEDFERALRQGIGHDGRTLFPFMPYDHFHYLADEDLASIIVFIRSIPPVRHQVPRIEWPAELKELVKPLPPQTSPVAPPDPNRPVERGKYLANVVAGCPGCHTPTDDKMRPMPGMDFAGGTPLWGPWGRVASQNLTPDPSGIPHYDEAMFLKTIRTGRVNGVRELNHIMPWKHFRHMTDEDLKAIFAYLRTLKPVRHRVDNAEPPTYCKLCRGTHGYGEKNQVP